MTPLEQAFHRLEERLTEYEARLTERLDRIERRLEHSEGRAVYDIASLREMGIPRDRAYAILRAHGSGRGPNGRRIITRSALDQALETPPS